MLDKDNLKSNSSHATQKMKGSPFGTPFAYVAAPGYMTNGVIPTTYATTVPGNIY